jgi:hypothetical protein
MTNIKCKSGKEIDLLAINPRNGKKCHVEARIGTSRGFKIREKDTFTSGGRAHKRGIDYFDKEKFKHPVILDKIKAIFGNLDYQKVLVVWDVENPSVVSSAKEKYNIEIRFLDEMLDEFYFSEAKGSRDDILRLIELFSLNIHRQQTDRELEILKHRGKEALIRRMRIDARIGKKWRTDVSFHTGKKGQLVKTRREKYVDTPQYEM